MNDGFSCFTDPALLKETLSNLLSNAVKYSPDGGTISISVRKNTEKIAITVKDTGCGIPRKEQEKVFTKFFRAPNAMKIKTDGTGLGLYLVQSLVKLLGGSITFTSEENKGTVFTIVLPERFLGEQAESPPLP